MVRGCWLEIITAVNLFLPRLDMLISEAARVLYGFSSFASRFFHPFSEMPNLFEI